MKNIIIWCNENIGFATIVLSIATLIVSIIAIAVSIRTAKLPFRKKLLVCVGSYVGTNTSGFYISVTNIGNRQLKLSEVGIKFNNQIYINKDMIYQELPILKQGEVTTQHYDILGLREKILEMNVEENTKMYAFAKDTEGKEYSKFLGKANIVTRANLN